MSIMNEDHIHYDCVALSINRVTFRWQFFLVLRLWLLHDIAPQHHPAKLLVILNLRSCVPAPLWSDHIILFHCLAPHSQHLFSRQCLSHSNKGWRFRNMYSMSIYCMFYILLKWMRNGYQEYFRSKLIRIVKLWLLIPVQKSWLISQMARTGLFRVPLIESYKIAARTMTEWSS